MEILPTEYQILIGTLSGIILIVSISLGAHLGFHIDATTNQSGLGIIATSISIGIALAALLAESTIGLNDNAIIGGLIGFTAIATTLIISLIIRETIKDINAFLQHNNT